MVIDFIISLGVIVVGATCFWAGFNVGRMTNRKS